jgi:hypothetical protein
MKTIKDIENEIEKILDTEPANDSEKEEQKEILKELEDELNLKKIEIAEASNESIVLKFSEFNQKRD